MGFAVLVVDLDLVFLKDPFEHLYRDADVEASTDGFTESWAGGQSVPYTSQRWAGARAGFRAAFHAQRRLRVFSPDGRALELLRRVATRLSQASAWDQQVFNQEAFMLSHGSYNGSKVAMRVMHYMEWVNSKVFFFSMRPRFFPARQRQGEAASHGPHELPSRQA